MGGPVHWNPTPRAPRDRMHMRIWAPMLAIGGGLLGACAGRPPQPAPSPANLPALEAAAQQNPRDAGVITRLGIANFEAKKFERARDVLLSALTITPQNYAAHIYLGLTYEELGRFDLARESYNTAADDGDVNCDHV